MERLRQQCALRRGRLDRAGRRQEGDARRLRVGIRVAALGQPPGFGFRTKATVALRVGSTPVPGHLVELAVVATGSRCGTQIQSATITPPTKLTDASGQMEATVAVLCEGPFVVEATDRTAFHSDGSSPRGRSTTLEAIAPEAIVISRAGAKVRRLDLLVSQAGADDAILEAAPVDVGPDCLLHTKDDLRLVGFPVTWGVHPAGVVTISPTTGATTKVTALRQGSATIHARGDNGCGTSLNSPAVLVVVDRVRVEIRARPGTIRVGPPPGRVEAVGRPGGGHIDVDVDPGGIVELVEDPAPSTPQATFREFRVLGITRGCAGLIATYSLGRHRAHDGPEFISTMQVSGSAPLMHERIKASDLPRLDPATFPLPLVSFPGVPKPPFDLANPEDPTAPALPGGPGSRMNPDVQAFNLAVPDFNLEMILTSTIPSGPRVSMVGFETARVVLKGPQFEQFRREQGLDKLDPALGDLGVRAPQVAQAKAISPSLVLVWGGTNDWIGALFRPDRIEQKMTSEQRFENLFQEIFVSQRPALGTGIVVATLPDLTRAPMMRPLGQPLTPLPFRIVKERLGFLERQYVEALERAVGKPIDQLMAELRLPQGVAKSIRHRSATGGEFTTGSTVPLANLAPDGKAEVGVLESVFSPVPGVLVLPGLPPLGKVILKQASTDLAGMAFFTPEEVLEPQEQLQVRGRVGAFNERIRRVAATHPTVAVVPVDDVFGGLSDRDRALQGGVFSADALHPNAIGQRLVAAEFIRAISAAIERALVHHQTFGGLRKQIQRP